MMNGYKDSQDFNRPVNPTSAIATGAGMGSAAGPYGAIAGGLVGAAVGTWEEMERRRKLGSLSQAQAINLLKQDLGGRMDPLTQQQYAETLAPTAIASKTLAGAGGGWQFGENVDDYNFKKKMRQDNPWAYLQASQKGTL